MYMQSFQVKSKGWFCTVASLKLWKEKKGKKKTKKIKNKSGRNNHTSSVVASRCNAGSPEKKING